MPTLHAQALEIPSDGEFYLAFYAGSYDRTGGRLLGAKMSIKGFKLLPEGCTVGCDMERVAPKPLCQTVVCDQGFSNADGFAGNGCEVEGI